MIQRVKDAGKSECHAVMVWIGAIMMKTLVEDTQSERMLAFYAGIDEKKAFSKFITIVLSWVQQ
ncbi:MAG: hypothetical protein CEE43_17745 [Promethearchaeota archaeon Loki_b32]|nr:MAG: hypothetical protein CEE43_17745 [Candidatus Lokiarchaeota archaeon Loki_b32]